MKAIPFALFVALLMVGCSSEDSAGPTNKDSSPSEGTETTSPPTNAQDDLFDRFKVYAEANPSLRNSFFHENEEPDASMAWLREEGLTEGYDSHRNNVALRGLSEPNLLPAIFRCLSELAAIYADNEIPDAKEDLQSFGGLNSVVKQTREANLFGLSFVEKVESTSIIGGEGSRETFESHSEVKTLGKYLGYSIVIGGKDDVAEDIQENGLSPLDLLKHLHHHENVILGIFRTKNDKRNTYLYEVIIVQRKLRG